MASLKKLPSLSVTSDKQTRAMVLAGLLLALLVFFVYAKPQQAKRDKEVTDYKTQLDILSKEKDNASKFLNPGAERDQYIASVAEADKFFPYLDPNSPSLELSLPSIIQTAATAVGLKLDAIPTGTKLDSIPGAPAGVQAIEMTLSIDATPKQIDDFIARLTESGRVRATIPSLTVQAKAPQVEGERPDLRDESVESFQLVIRLWYTTVPPLSSAGTTTPSTTPAQGTTSSLPSGSSTTPQPSQPVITPPASVPAPPSSAP